MDDHVRFTLYHQDVVGLLQLEVSTIVEWMLHDVLLVTQLYHFPWLAAHIQQIDSFVREDHQVIAPQHDRLDLRLPQVVALVSVLYHKGHQVHDEHSVGVHVHILAADYQLFRVIGSLLDHEHLCIVYLQARLLFEDDLVVVNGSLAVDLVQEHSYVSVSFVGQDVELVFIADDALHIAYLE